MASVEGLQEELRVLVAERHPPTGCRDMHKAGTRPISGLAGAPDQA